MRLPSGASSNKTKISSPLVQGSLNSSDSEPIDISSGSAPRTSSDGFTLSVTSAHDSLPLRSYSGTSYDLNPHAVAAFHPHTVGSYARRSSFNKSAGPFVGSYEESILSGRMSQQPSKPLQFTASIGVLGRGDCKPSLRCPPHLTVPFPAYFYSDMSPYVGQIDLDVDQDGKKQRGYRIPAAGQLQVIIRNPNKTAVKLFLIPYDLSDMPPLSKTFFRQKHYDCQQGSQKLRYAIHVQICCTAEGRLFVHKTQRVVFANRVPDGKEKLHVAFHEPTEQKYTAWVPEKRSSRQHKRPDRHQPAFIGGSLLDTEEGKLSPLLGASSPPGLLPQHMAALRLSPLLQSRKTPPSSSLRQPSHLSLLAQTYEPQAQEGEAHDTKKHLLSPSPL
ncbi:hypothetical protein BCR37DRAFT_392810 [Protomyces lactucae-debilis]|uniref:Atos-like conserved domain-containing protein n=1 Tax=Protomyces lactucae-debilis TaxID=2754530 RepID=A0A1Y2FF70_PROLT|nr:uncharacterized protein BCR37DRAFT_392810 [Protomyces lactucae-debilis]ORY82610.1 hypothetical protein BCR37DRAFT_392810 [Protomyces lactucae-debilis]